MTKKSDVWLHFTKINKTDIDRAFKLKNVNAVKRKKNQQIDFKNCLSPNVK